MENKRERINYKRKISHSSSYHEDDSTSDRQKFEHMFSSDGMSSSTPALTLTDTTNSSTNSLLTRISAFMPVMAAANKELETNIESNRSDPSSYLIDMSLYEDHAATNHSDRDTGDDIDSNDINSDHSACSIQSRSDIDDEYDLENEIDQDEQQQQLKKIKHSSEKTEAPIIEMTVAVGHFESDPFFRLIQDDSPTEPSDHTFEE